MFTLTELKANSQLYCGENHVYFGHCSFTIIMSKKEKSQLTTLATWLESPVYGNHLLTLKLWGSALDKCVI